MPSLLRLLGYCGALSGTASLTVNVIKRYFDGLEGTDLFSQHTTEQHQKHPFSGMHEPYLPTLEQQQLFFKYFPQYSHILPTSLDAFKQQQVLETAVKIKSLAYCPVTTDHQEASTIVVGGPPALISSANQKNITYINDARRRPIAWGSAFHLEWDAESEAPASYLPSQFMVNQLLRMFFKYENLRQAEKTGQFSWRSLDWVCWIKHPSQWPEGVRVALAFQRFTQATLSPEKRENILQEVASRCKANQAFYEQLNRDLEGKLFLPGRGSIIVARTPEEKKALLSMKEGLIKEGRDLPLLSKEEMINRFGFVPPEGIAFAEKVHDAVISPNFMELIARRIQMLGGKVINGTLKTIYVDDSKQGGLIKYKTPDGKKSYAPFSQLVLSLGNQRIIGQDGKPIFDIVAARGVSVLAIAYVPKGRKLPPLIVCGGTNHATQLSAPISLQGEDGVVYDRYLLRMTAGACITPNVSERGSADYDANAAVGLISAVQKTLDCRLEVLSVYGCNRQVSEHGQSHWISNPKNNETASPLTLVPRGHQLDRGTYRFSSGSIVIQMGAGGGGLTQGPAQPPLKGS